MATKREQYFRAAQEHLEVARILLNVAAHNKADDCYLVIHYECGLAVECMLRAYAWRGDEPFDARHDLERIYEKASFVALFPKARVEEYEAAFAEIVRRWNSNHRYCSVDELKGKLRKAGLSRGVRGDFLKHNCRTIYGSALKLIQIGVIKWVNS